MKKIIYIFLTLLIFVFLLSLVLKRDSGVDEIVENNLEPLNIVKINEIKKENLTLDGVDYLKTYADLGKFGGTFVSSTIGEGPKTFNPFNVNDATSSSITSLMFDGLLGVNPYNGKFEAKLAKDFSISPDGKTYKINLRKGIKWSDGREITADDVYFTYNTIIFGGFGNTSTRDMLYIDGKLPTVQKCGKYCVEFTTSKPFYPFLMNLTTPIAPKHIFEVATKAGVESFNSFYSTATNPKKFVTSGAFRIKEYIPAQRVVFEKNKNYYIINKNNEKLPYLDEYVIQIVGDINNETLKFEAGEIDILNLQGSLVGRYRILEKNSDFALYNTGPTSNTTFLMFNINNRKGDKGKYYVDPIKQKWFQSLNFRTAVDWAIDRDSIVMNILSGIGEPLFLPEGPSSIYLNKKLSVGHKKDLNYAKSLLKKDGFYWDKDGALIDKNDNRVEFELLTNVGNTQREAVGISIKEDLSELGIKVNFKPIEFNTFVNRLTNSYEWEAGLIALTGNPLDPYSGNNVFTSFGTLHMFNQRNEKDKAEPKILPFEEELDDIFLTAPLTMDFKTRKKMYDKYQEIMYREKPLIYLYSPTIITAIRNKFGNIAPTPLGGTIYNLEEIYLK